MSHFCLPPQRVSLKHAALLKFHDRPENPQEEQTFVFPILDVAERIFLFPFPSDLIFFFDAETAWETGGLLEGQKGPCDVHANVCPRQAPAPRPTPHPHEPAARARGSQAALKPEPATAFPTLTGGYHQPFRPSEKVLGGRGVCSPREPGVSCWAGGTGAPHGAWISAAKGTPGSGRGDSQASPVASVCTTYGFQLFLTTYRILGQSGGYTARASFSRDASRRNSGVRRLRMPHFQMRWGRAVPAASGQ